MSSKEWVATPRERWNVAAESWNRLDIAISKIVYHPDDVTPEKIAALKDAYEAFEQDIDVDWTYMDGEPEEPVESPHDDWGVRSLSDEDIASIVARISAKLEPSITRSIRNSLPPQRNPSK